MKEVSLKEMKELLLEEMKYIDYFCQKNNLNYFLIGGSLLGAVRHQGFIPWDDDIDIGMLRGDYNKFLEVFSKEKGRYKLVNSETMKGYYLPFAKIIDTKTSLFEEVKDGIELGIGIDIFPFDNCPAGNYKKACKFANNLRLRIFRNILIVKSLILSKKRKLLKNLIIMLVQIFFKWISRKYLIKKINLIAIQYLEQNDTKYVAELLYMPYGNNEIYKKEWVSKTMRLPFEEYEFNVPIEYQKFLKKTFGDYMKLPPVAEQISHHDFKCWLKE